MRRATVLGTFLLAVSCRGPERFEVADEAATPEQQGLEASRTVRETHCDLVPLEAPTHLDQEFRNWDAGAQERLVPPDAIRAPDLDISGEWCVSRGYDSTFLTIRPVSGDRYEVCFATHGCVGGWKLHRVATFREGVLVLDEPVEEYFPLMYARLYPVKITGEDCLISSDGVKQLEDEFLVWYVFRRPPENGDWASFSMDNEFGAELRNAEDSR